MSSGTDDFHWLLVLTKLKQNILRTNVEVPRCLVLLSCSAASITRRPYCVQVRCPRPATSTHSHLAASVQKWILIKGYKATKPANSHFYTIKKKTRYSNLNATTGDTKRCSPPQNPANNRSVNYTPRDPVMTLCRNIALERKTYGKVCLLWCLQTPYTANDIYFKCMIRARTIKTERGLYTIM